MDVLLRVRHCFGVCAALIATGSCVARAADATRCDTEPAFSPHPPAGIAAINDGPKIPFLSVSTHSEPRQREILDRADGLWASWKANTGHRIVESGAAYCGANCYFDIPAGRAVHTLIAWASQAGLEARFREQVFASASTSPIKGCYAPLEALRALFANTQLGRTGIIPDLVYIDSAGRADVGLFYFDIPAGDAPTSLRELGRQSKLQLHFDPADVSGRQTKALQGFYTFWSALRTFVPDGSLRFDFVDSRTLSVSAADAVVAGPAAPVRRESRSRRWFTRLRSLFGGTAAGIPEVVIAAEQGREVVPSPGEPVVSYAKAEFDSSAALSIPELLQTIPQVFAGGPNEYTQIGREAATNSTRGVGFNLRGLDAGDTLVLLDGQRLAGSGTAAEYADVSMIPLGAIERIDIVADGPSLQYGADAVTGIVNFVTRDDFSGAETQAKFGTAPGGVGERQVSQLWGLKWDDGHASLDFEYYERDALRSDLRAQATSDLTRWGGENWGSTGGYPGNLVIGTRIWPILSSLNGRPVLGQEGVPNLYDWWSGQDILPRQKRFSVRGRIAATVGDAELWSRVWVSNRHSSYSAESGLPITIELPRTNPGYVNPLGGTAPVSIQYSMSDALGPWTFATDSLSGNIACGVRWLLARWLLEGSVSTSWERGEQIGGGEVDQAALSSALDATDPELVFNPFEPRANPAVVAGLRGALYYESHSNLREVAASASRTLLETRGGDVNLLLGAQYRHEALSSHAPNLEAAEQWEALQRGIAAAYAQVAVPVSTGVSVVAGARLEHYERGNTVVSPKASLAWAVEPYLTLRGSFGKAFRAPALTDVLTSNNISEIVTLPGGQQALGVVGGNPDLKPEVATTWTGGFDLDTDSGLAVGATYFAIHSRDRVVQPQFAEDFATFDGILVKNPTAAQQRAVCAQGTFIGGSQADCANTPVAYLIDARQQNLQTLSTSGVDLTVKYTRAGWGVRLDATHLFKYAEVDPAAPASASSYLNAPGYPVDLRGRAAFSKSLGGFAASLAVNYTGSYANPNSQPARRVGSWTTLDVQFLYHPGHTAWLRGTDFSLGARNLCNRAPPFVDDGSVRAGWDPANGGNLLGRVVTAGVRLSW